MSFDISHLLDGWDYQPGQIAVRKFKTRAGVEKIQLRLDLGLLQMNVEGRPDGKRPYGRETLLDHYQTRAKRRLKAKGAADESFRLTPEQSAKLQQEAVQFHHRYICLFQLKDYHGVIRDTERNLRAFEFMKKHSPAGDVGWPLQHLIPQLLMLQTRAKGMLAVEADDHGRAIQQVEAGLDALRNFYRELSRTDLFDHSAEMQSLESFLQDLQTTRPLTQREQLQRALEEAIRREDYERAAELRDRIKSLDLQSQS